MVKPKFKTEDKIVLSLAQALELNKKHGITFSRANGKKCNPKANWTNKDITEEKFILDKQETFTRDEVIKLMTRTVLEHSSSEYHLGYYKEEALMILHKYDKRELYGK